MVGRSEANLRNALKTAESISQLFIDELDKSFAGTSGSSDSDGGLHGSFYLDARENFAGICDGQ